MSTIKCLLIKRNDFKRSQSSSTFPEKEALLRKSLILVVSVSWLLSLIAFFPMLKNEVCFALIRVKFCCVTQVVINVLL